ncbi:MAG TPA: hypothetical protein PKC18_04760 [Lacipirellulaceae bacterium]|nr:hypothetical protein [Lacipirellulaceae bacterium]
MWRKLRIENLEDRRVLSADFNGDATVDNFDLAIWAFGYGMETTATGAQGDADGDGNVDGNDFLVFQRQLGPTKNNLIAYRPQSVQDPDDPIDGPIYAPFPKKPVRELDEAHNTLGPGIRINHDDDDNNGTPDALQVVANIPLENDLIAVKVERLQGTGDLVLTKGFNLRLYYDHKKSDLVVFPGGGSTSEVLQFDNSSLTIFVEWISATHGTDTLNLVEPGTATTHDTVRFHTFRSLTVVFGGRGQDPEDTDGDGSIGDPRPGPMNREGIFDLAQALYDTGWDVMAFDEADYTPLLGQSVAEREIKNAIDNRFVHPQFGGGVALWGYSQGGGVVHSLIKNDLDPINNFQYTPIYAVYLDAVRHDSFVTEDRWPGAVYYLLNIYQANEIGGGDIDDNEVLPGAIMEEVNVTTDPNFVNTLNHSQIDDDLDVWLLILLRQNQLLNP